MYSIYVDGTYIYKMVSGEDDTQGGAILVESFPEPEDNGLRWRYAYVDEKVIIEYEQVEPTPEPEVDRVTQLEEELALTQTALDELIVLVLGGGN